MPDSSTNAMEKDQSKERFKNRTAIQYVERLLKERGSILPGNGYATMI